MDKSLAGAPTLDQRDPASNGKKRSDFILQTSRTIASPPDVVSFHILDHPLFSGVGSYLSTGDRVNIF